MRGLQSAGGGDGATGGEAAALGQAIARGLTVEEPAVAPEERALGARRVDEVKRRAYLVGLAVGLPTLPVVWAAHAGGDPVLRVTYPLLGVALLAAAVALFRRLLAVRTLERLVFTGLAGLYLGRLALAFHGGAELDVVMPELTTSVYWNLCLVVTFAYLAFDTRAGRRIAIGVIAVAAAIAAARLVPEVRAGRHVEDAVAVLRITAFLAVQVALLSGLAHLKEELAETRAAVATMADMANRDALTGIANRRRLQSALIARMADADRYGRPLSVMLVDIDRFKLLNDQHGHEAGDEVLQGVVAVLAAELRTTDLLGRWGGEEFLVVAAETDGVAAASLAERCRVALAAAALGHGGPVTASFGVAGYRPGDTLSRLVSRADDALYDAKRGGRNLVRSSAG